MDKYKIKDLKERLAKETSQEHKNKLLYMWIKQDHISLQEYNSLVINHSDLSHVSESVTWTTDEVLNIIEENEHIDDLKMFFTEHGR